MAERNLITKPRSRSALEKNLKGRPLPSASPASPASPTPQTATQHKRLLDLPAAGLFTAEHTSVEAESESPKHDESSSGGLPAAVAEAAAPLVLETSKRLTRASARQIAKGDSGPGTAIQEDNPDHPQPPSLRPSSENKRKSSRKRMASTGSRDNINHLSTQNAKRRKKIASKPQSSSFEEMPLPAGSVSGLKGKVVAKMSTRMNQESSDVSEGRHKGDSRNKEKKDPSSPGLPSHSTQHVFEAEDLDTAMAGSDETGSELTPVIRKQTQDDVECVSADDNDDGDNDDEDNENEDPDFGETLRRYNESELGDAFGAGFSASYRSSGLPAALSMLGGMLSMSGMSGRLREILGNLGRKEDSSLQLIALQDLSEILLVSNEENLIGSFTPDPYVRELVCLMQPNEITGEENPEIMLLACRCLANLMEAIPASTANVVYGGAVPILCQKLLEISFIDLAEQALSTLEKISVEYPSRIVREGGLTACLSYLEFFATSTQRTAVTTAANCCRNISESSFSVVCDVMPILLNVLNSNDQRVVEQASLCVSRIVESFKHFPSKLEELVDVDLLKAILGLLLPGSANHSIGPNLHTQFLRVLAIIADASPRLAAELFKMNVVETLYQILTGVTPPAETDDVAANLDSILIMQALTHRPREQFIETLNVICNLLPSEVDASQDGAAEDFPAGSSRGSREASRGKPQLRRKTSGLDKIRLKFLEGCKGEVRRFALILLPTLSDAYSSTVNLDIRQRVMTAQVRMLSNFDREIILEALKEVPYASFLASILSQQDHPSLVGLALQATDLLMSRLEKIYRYQLYREGVINEIEEIAIVPEDFEAEASSNDAPDNQNIAAEQLDLDNHSDGHRSPSDSIDINNRGSHESISHSSDHDDDETCGGGHNLSFAGGSGNSDIYELSIDTGTDLDVDNIHKSNAETAGDSQSRASSNGDEDGTETDKIDEDAEDENENESHIGDEGGVDDENHDDTPGSPASSYGSDTSYDFPLRNQHATNAPLQTHINLFARRFLVKHEIGKNDDGVRLKATQTLSSLTSLANEIAELYLGPHADTFAIGKGIDLFKRLAGFFDSNVVENATSAELLGSGLVNVFERIFGNADQRFATAARSAFLECFIGHQVNSQLATQSASVSTTPFSVLVHKLQDLLSRSENFEVITVHHNTFDRSQTSAASMLAKQIRLRLVADDDPDIPTTYRDIMVSIHAIATFKTLEEYLRPRIELSVRSRIMRRDGLSRALAAINGSNGANASTLSAATAARLAMERSNLFSGSSLPPDVLKDQSLPAILDSRQTKPAPQKPRASRTRSHRKMEKAKAAKAGQLNTPGTASDTDDKRKNRPRRSFRHHASSSSKSKSAFQEDEYDASTNALEERQAAEAKDDREMNDTGAADATVGSLDEELTAGGALEAPAVNAEIAGGGKIFTRQENLVSTPSKLQNSIQSLDSSASALSAALRGDFTTPSRSMAPRMPSSDSVIQFTRDWHMEFTLDGKPVSMDSTVYRAVFDPDNGRSEQLNRSVWSSIHTVHYRRVSGPQPSEPVNCGVAVSAHIDSGNTTIPGTADSGCSDGPSGIASSKLHGRDPVTLSILRLLKNLHEFNANIDDIFIASEGMPTLKAEPVLQFVNTKLTAKLNRQLEEPLIVASNCLPNWSEDLARLYPFLFPFETRHLFLQSTSFGYARSMTRWQNTKVQEDFRRDRRDERPFLGRLQRQKVRISRSKILESAVKVMELYGASQSILEVEYFEEVGTGLGPTLEFYSTVSREFSKKKYRLWRDSDPGDSEFVLSSSGLFPRPLSETDTEGTNGERLMSLFEALGKFVARSMLDSRIIDINFNPIFFRIGDGSSKVRPSLGALNAVDSALARSLLLIQKFATTKEAIEKDTVRSAMEKTAAIAAITINNTRIEDYSLDFTLPGYPDIELIPGGSQTSVTIDNVGTYVERVVSMTLEGGVRRQVDAFQKGFSQVFPYSALSAFTPDELVSLFGRIEEDWSLETLVDSVKADHGFNMDSRSVRNLLQVMSEMTLAERRDFLKFTTGSPRLPIGGFRSLTPTFTVVCKPSEAPYSSDDYLPSVMTCVNYLKLPNYTSIDILRKQLSTAIKEGQGAFHLS
ncbi:Ubiquitin fusion degradation protein 4 [Sporothrix epigloea]|uniref:HECT-type E3 ubiquitin transferase n=1 Tax=Sporothrix epigloea TaxID=1892477 RepID=A0ABP0E0S6_9PEZI